MAKNRSTKAQAPTWHAIQAEVHADGALATRAGPVTGRRSPHACGIVTSLGDALNKPSRPRPDGTPEPPTWLVAPSRRIGHQWVETLVRLGHPVVNLQITTVAAIAFDVLAADLAAEARTVASPRAKQAIIERLLVTHHAALESLTQSTVSVTRLANRILHSIDVLRMAGLRPDAVGNTLREQAKGRDLAVLMGEYEKELDSLKLIDQAGQLARATHAVTLGKVPHSIERLLVPSDLELSKLENDLLQAFRSAQAVRVEDLTADPPVPVSRPAEQPEHDPVMRAAAWSPQFFQAVGEANEVRHVLRTCLKKGLRFDEVEIIHSDSATYPSLIREIVAALPRPEDLGTDDGATRHDAKDIPVTFAEGWSVRDSKPGRALIAWMQWQRDGHTQSGLERMLREGLLHVRSDAHTASSLTLVRMIRELHFTRGLDRLASSVAEELKRTKEMKLEDFLAQRVDGDHDRDEPTAEEFAVFQQRRMATLESLLALSTGLQSCDPAPGKPLVTATPESLLKCAHSFLENYCTIQGEFDALSQSRLREELADALLWRNNNHGAGTVEVAQWIEQLPGELVVMGAGPRPGCLYVSPIASGGHSGRPYTFFIGLNEDRFPGGEADDPVLTDSDRSRLTAAHPESGLREARLAARSNTDNWWKLLARLGGELFLGFSCRDTGEGAEMFPSPVLLSLFGRIHDKPSVKAKDFIAVAGIPEAFVPQDESLALDETQARLAIIGPNATQEVRLAAVRAHRDHLPNGVKAEEERQSNSFTPYDGNVPSAGPLLDPCASDGREASPHSLETLGACPRRFFFRYGLGIRPHEPPLGDCDRWLGALEVGTVIHAVLEKFVRSLIERDMTPTADAVQTNELLGLLDVELSAWKQRMPPVTTIAFDSTRHTLADTLNTFLLDEQRHCLATGTRPMAIEVAIGLDPSEPGTPFDSPEPVTIRLPADKELTLRGRIDRIDFSLDHAGGRIYSLWDYKTGSDYTFPAEGEDDPFVQGRKLQHGLYILMLRAHLDRTEEAATAGNVERFGYFFPSRSGKGKRLEWSADRLAQCVTLVGQLATIAREGAFLPTTEKKDCEHCKFTPVCGEPAAVTRQANTMISASTTLQTLFKELTSSPQGTATLATRQVNQLPLALTPHVQGPATPPDENARQRIRTDFDNNLLVEASAGTGKTTCIVDRLLGLIRFGKALPHAIVAVTFTRKAAGELRRRFREQLYEVAAEDITTEEQLRLDNAIDHADSMVIGTIHSFAARLLRERAVDAGVDPGFTELDDAADRLLREQAWTAFTESAATLHPGLVKALEDVGLRLGDLHFAFVNDFAEYGDIEQWPAPPTPLPDINKALKDLEPFVEQIRTATFSPAEERGTDELMTDLEQFVRMYDRTDTKSTVAVMELIQTLDREPTLTQKYWPNAADPDKARSTSAKAVATQWRDDWARVRTTIAEPNLWTWRAHRYPTVIETLTAAKNTYDSVRRDRGCLSFHDLLSKAVDLLKTSREARVEFRSRYTHILVDEFQDTDPLQAELLLLLCATDTAEPDSLKCVPSPGSLFVVGDPKQSLYRFRRADIVTYTRVKQIFSTHGEVLELTTTFRSRSDLVDFTNGMFSQEFPPAATRESPAFVVATSGRRDAPAPASAAAASWLCGVRALRYVRKYREGKAWAVAEARAIAEFIRAAIDGHYLVPRTEAERETNVPFECSARDFLIVARERAHLSIYAAALQAVGLSVDVTGGLGADQADALRTLRGCLAAVAAPDDPVAILALLRGAVFGFSDDELLDYKRNGGTFSGGIDKPTGLAPQLRQRCSEARASLWRWRQWGRRLPVAAAVERIIDDAGLLLIASWHGTTGSSGRSIVGLLQRYLELVRQNRDTLLSLQDCLEALDDLLAPKTKRQFDPLAIDPEASDRVRLMNLHKAKGLEAPVVFLCDYQMHEPGTKATEEPTLHVDRLQNPPQGSLSVMRRNGKTKQVIAAPPNWTTLWAEERQFEDAEYKRVDYVAATRPGTALIVSQFEKFKEGTTGKRGAARPDTFTAEGSWHRFGPYLDSMPDIPLGSPPPSCGNGPDDEAIRRAAAVDSSSLRATILAQITALTEPTFARISPREILTESAEGLRYTGQGRGEEWGRVIHKLLELATRMPAFDIEPVARTVLSAEQVPLEHLPDAITLVTDIMSSNLWRETQESPEHFSEVPFSIQVAGESLADEARTAAGLTDPPLPTVIRGVIDRVFRDKDATWRVIDWKTDAVRASSKSKLEDHYRPQVSLYAECWRLIRDHKQAHA